MKYKDIIEFFDAIEKNISGNINLKNRNTMTHDIVVTIYINMTSILHYTIKKRVIY